MVSLARRLEHETPGVSASILEDIDEILSVTRLGLPLELRRSLTRTTIIGNMNGRGGSVATSNTGRTPPWRYAGRAPPCAKPPRAFRKLKAHKQLPALRAAVAALLATHASSKLDESAIAA